jgi:uncharacterized protein with ParB-like and HNH nuclease domain
MSENIIVDSISFKDLLSKKLAIPEYQRPYVWSKIEIEKLLFQFSEHINREDEKPNFYLGSIVLHKNGNEYNIIDGQQRITTMQILQLIKNKQTFEITYDHPITQKHIKDNYSFFKDKEFKLINFESINVTIVITESEDMAYNFFETLNTGGKRLGGTDILKAHHLRCIKENDERNSYALKWEKKQKNLETVNRILSKIRRMDYLKRNQFIPDKFTGDNKWKSILTEDFAEKAKKDNRDIGYSFVEIEENTHTITADKYAIRQPLNEGYNYINYLLNFTDDYNFLFTIPEDKKDKYSNFNREIINHIDGTVDLRSYYQLTMLCFVDRFGRKNVLEFSLYLFRFIYSLRLSEQSRIYEATVRNFIADTLILERILNSFTYEEILNYIKNYKFQTTKDVSGVKQRFLNRVSGFFGNISSENFSSDIEKQIENYLKK